jgi:hypothetical protein
MTGIARFWNIERSRMGGQRGGEFGNGLAGCGSHDGEDEAIIREVVQK